MPQLPKRISETVSGASRILTVQIAIEYNTSSLSHPPIPESTHPASTARQDAFAEAQEQAALLLKRPRATPSHCPVPKRADLGALPQTPQGTSPLTRIHSPWGRRGNGKTCSPFGGQCRCIGAVKGLSRHILATLRYSTFPLTAAKDTFKCWVNTRTW